MQRLINSLKTDIQNKNYYSAIFIGLSLIDICSKIEYDIRNNHQRFTKWLNTFFLPLYERDIPNPFIPANAIYQLRCSVLHEGTNTIDENNKEKYEDIKNLYRIIFTLTPSHRNKSSIGKEPNIIEEIQINIHTFIEEIINSIQIWMSTKDKSSYTLDFSIENISWSTTDKNGACGFKDCS
jgi:hypothetical protein